MTTEYLMQIANAIFSSYTTWILFFVLVLIPLLSKSFMDYLSDVLLSFDITLTDRQKKQCSRFVKLIFLNVFVASIFFYAIVSFINL